jgi:hypothetical protein
MSSDSGFSVLYLKSGRSFRFASLSPKWWQSRSLRYTVSQLSDWFTRKGYAMSEWFVLLQNMGQLTDGDEF